MNSEITGLSPENADAVVPTSVPNDALISAELKPTVNTNRNKVRWVSVLLVAGVLVTGLIFLLFYQPEVYNQVLTFISANVTSDIFLYMLGGFLAQMVDGALGMAYGLTSTTFLLSFGIPPAAASASVHASEIFTSGASGLMHLKLKNVNKKLFRLLLIPGVTGAILGAYILSSLEAYNYIMKPLVAIYTLVLGILIIIKAFRPKKKRLKSSRIAPLAIFGGFMDSVGGGGWGPVVSSTLIAGGRNPRFAIGSVNLAEFFIALSSTLTFFTMIGLHFWQIIVGLIIGGVIAAPIAANLSKNLPIKTLMILVGSLVILVSLRILYMAIQ